MVASRTMKANHHSQRPRESRLFPFYVSGAGPLLWNVWRRDRRIVPLSSVAERLSCFHVSKAPA